MIGYVSNCCERCAYFENNTCYRSTNLVHATAVAPIKPKCKWYAPVTNEKAVLERKENIKRIKKSLNANGLRFAKYFNTCMGCEYCESRKCYFYDMFATEINEYMLICENFVKANSKHAPEAIERRKQNKAKDDERIREEEERLRKEKERERIEQQKREQAERDRQRNIEKQRRKKEEEERRKREAETAECKRKEAQAKLEALIRDANKGDASAQANLAQRYLGANGVERDYVKAIEWFVKGAENGSDKAITELTKMYNSENLNKVSGELADKWKAIVEKENKRREEAEAKEREKRRIHLSLAKDGNKLFAWDVANKVYYGKNGYERDITLAAELFVKGYWAELAGKSWDFWDYQVEKYYDVFVGSSSKEALFGYSERAQIRQGLSNVDNVISDLKKRRAEFNRKKAIEEEKRIKEKEFAEGKCKTCDFCYTDKVKKSKEVEGFFGTNTTYWEETVYYCYHMTGRKEYVDPNRKCNQYEKRKTRADAGYR